MFQRLKSVLPILLLVPVIAFFLGGMPWVDAISSAVGHGLAIYIFAVMASILLSHRRRVWSAWSIFALVAASIFLVDHWSVNDSAIGIAINIGIALALAGLFIAFVFVNRKTRRPYVIPQVGRAPE